MPPSEAYTVTALGMLAVFVGLVLCIAFIELFRRLAMRVSNHGVAAAAEAAAVREAPEPVPDDVLAVIVAVLEVERALYVGRNRGRLTLRREP